EVGESRWASLKEADRTIAGQYIILIVVLHTNKDEKGQTLALVGSSGCGKSTVVQLLSG
uniref:ABC transporter domain-containing protein n=1 Tax=Gopherus agassizii TaxID=38772 RepID=A0A452GPD0_9SAUR